MTYKRSRHWAITATEVNRNLGASFWHSIDEARAAVPKGLVCLPRDPSDPKCVVETWL